MKYNDAELPALSALAMQEAVGMQGENEYRKRTDHSPAYAEGMLGFYGQKLADELLARENEKEISQILDAEHISRLRAELGALKELLSKFNYNSSISSALENCIHEIETILNEQ